MSKGFLNSFEAVSRILSSNIKEGALGLAVSSSAATVRVTSEGLSARFNTLFTGAFTSVILLLLIFGIFQIVSSRLLCLLKKSTRLASPSSSHCPTPSTSTVFEARVPSDATPPSTALSVESFYIDEMRRLSPSCSTFTSSPAASFVPATSSLRRRTSSFTQTSTRGRRLLLLLTVEAADPGVLPRRAVPQRDRLRLDQGSKREKESWASSQYLWQRKPTPPVRRSCSVPNPWWRKPTQLTPPNTVNNSSKYCQYFGFICTTFCPLVLYGQVLLYSFLPYSGGYQGPVEGFFPRDAPPDSMQSRPVGRSLKPPGLYQLHPRSVKSSCLPKNFYWFISAVHLCLTPLSNVSWSCSWSFLSLTSTGESIEGSSFSPSKGRLSPFQDLSGTFGAGIQGPRHRELSSFSQGELRFVYPWIIIIL